MRLPGFLLFLVMLLSSLVQAQQLKYYPAFHAAELVIGNDTLHSPWSGGLQNPQFSEIDLNGDGQLDLFVFEPVDNQVLTFLYEGFGQYRYAPEYQTAFPHMTNFALLRDYNMDGKADIFTYSGIGGGMDVYQNVSNGPQLKFKLVVVQMPYKDVGGWLNLYVPPTDVPVITDMDGDGDLDILAFDVLQSFVQYYKNQSMEKYGKPDSLYFQIKDRCWGKFQLSFTDNSVQLGVSCGKVMKRDIVMKQMHGGSSMVAIDLDGDGDKDVLLSDIGYPNLVKIMNGRIRSGQPNLDVDSCVSLDTLWPNSSMRANIPLFPSAFEIDVNHDGKKDILASPMQQYESIDQNQVFYYQNTGTSQNPSYQLIQKNFLESLMFDGGTHAAPALADLNGDGLPDLVVASKANPERIYTYDKLTLFINKGTAKKAVFVKTADDFAGLSQRKEAYLRPCFGDLDGDGLMDMVIGKEDGTLLYYKNKGLKNGIPEMSLVSDNFANINVSQYSAPYLADLDKDGLLDIAVGKRSGTISYYHNTGTKSQPDFSLVTDSMGRIHTNKYYYEYEYDSSGNVSDSTLRMESIGASCPVIADLDGDGKLDMVTGSVRQNLYFYFNIEGDPTRKFEKKDSLFYSKLYGRMEKETFGTLTVPAAADLNGDTLKDLIIGNYRAGLYYYGTKEDPTSIKTETAPALGFNIYPNPARDIVSISLQEKPQKAWKISCTNMLGQRVFEKTFGISEETAVISVKGWKEGIYLLNISMSDGTMTTAKLVINR